ncbi:MAG: histidinol-phosphate transaminase [Lachnospiraceae bacterium]|nr:histidinol-phosphate transaminase [Lachnospiraceae bacterium]
MSWENNVRRVVPYVPGEQPNKPNMIKLNTNECPYPPAKGVQEAMKDLHLADFRLYPDPEAGSLVETLAEYYGLTREQVFVGVGSDDVLAIAFQTFFNSEKPILFPQITYSFYDVWADLYRIPYEAIPLKDDFHINPVDYKKENGGIIFPNPNAPTGLLESLDTVEEIVKANPDVVVIVDEAYIDFGGKSALALIDTYENLLVVQTFSKSRAMAGMRIGFAMGNPKLIKYLNDVKFSTNSYTMNRPSLVLGMESVKDDDYFKETTAKIIATRERVKNELAALGFEFPDSMSNFIFAKHPDIPGTELYEALRGKNIFVRHFNNPLITEYNRITIGTDEEMDVFLACVKEYMKEKGV